MDSDSKFAKTTLKNICRRDGSLATKDPIGRAITIVDSEPIGIGSQRIAFRAQLVYSKIDEQGYRELYVPMRTHQNLRGTSLEEWQEARKAAEQEASEMSKSGLEKEVRDFFEENELINGNRAIAVSVSKLPQDMNWRSSREGFILGLYHPNLTYHFTAGLVETSGQGYMLVELFDGSLDPEKTKNWEAKTHIRVMEQVIKGLKRLRDLGIVHRDIKPGNLFVKKRTTVKIADYGIMRPENVELTRTTMEGNIIGTAPYMSPEQARNSKDATWLSDQFSAGATFYELITDRLPLGLKDEKVPPREILVSIARERQYKIKGIADEQDILLEGIERIIAKMMQNNPHKRYQDYSLILQDLDRVESRKLPRHAPAGLVESVFMPAKYTNYHHNRRVKMIAAGIISALAAGGAAAYFSGLLDRIVRFQ
ncbi:MAG: protein kinase [Candidatus Woesearchaeota archaeon]